MMGRAVPILMYHEVSPAPPPQFRRYTVTPRQFARQMRWLAAGGYEAISMDRLVQARQGRERLPKRPVVITFDDGYQGCVDHAVPVLRAHGFTAMFYLVAGLMGQSSRWMRAEVGLELPLMSWDTARSLVRDGFHAGAHTVTHVRLAGLDLARCRAELAEARSRIEAELNRPAVHLAYPYGAYDSAVRDLTAEAGYITACTTLAGLSEPTDDLLAIHRVSVYGHESLLDFASRVRTGMTVRERMRRSLGRLTGRLTGHRPRPH